MDARPPRVDVAVVGGGLAGVGAARLLARAGVDVLLLEAGPELGCGISGRMPGMALGWLSDHPERLAQALGRQRAQQLLRFVNEGRQLLAELLGACQGFGLTDGRLVPGDANEARELQVERIPGACSFDERAALEQLWREALQAGAQGCLGQRVLALVEESSGSQALLLAVGRVSAELVILAAGAGSRDLDPFLADTVVPVRRWGLELGCQGRDQGPSLFSAWRGALRGRRLASRWQLWGGRPVALAEDDSVHPSPATQEAIQAQRGFEAFTLDFMARRFNCLGREPLRSWGAAAAHSCDGLPLLGPVPGRQRRVVCTGFSGQDFDLALRAARAVAEGVLTGRAAGVPSFLSPSRFL